MRFLPGNLSPFYVLPICAAALCLLLAGCGRESAGAGARGAAVPVQVAQASRQSVPLVEQSVGSVQALRRVEVRAQVDGVVQAVHFQEGQSVQSGDLLVTLDRRPFENALAIARAQLASARAELAIAQQDAARYRELGTKSVVSAELLGQFIAKEETALAKVHAQEAAVANAELDLGYTEIRAPIAGRTGQRLLHEGTLVKARDAASTLVTIQQIAPIAVAYGVPERVLGTLQAAQAAGPVAVSCTTHDMTPRTLHGVLEFVDNTVDPTTGMVTLKAVFPNEDQALWPGRFVEVRTELGRDPAALVVPTAAVMPGQKGSQIFVVKADQTVELRPVQPVRSFEGLTLLGGNVVREGETVVTDGQLRLVPGVRVEIRTLDGAPAARKP